MFSFLDHLDSIYILIDCDMFPLYGRLSNHDSLSAFATSALSLSLRAWHATVYPAPEGTHDVLVLRKGTGAVALGGAVARAQLCCQK